MKVPVPGKVPSYISLTPIATVKTHVTEKVSVPVKAASYISLPPNVTVKAHVTEKIPVPMKVPVPVRVPVPVKDPSYSYRIPNVTAVSYTHLTLPTR